VGALIVTIVATLVVIPVVLVLVLNAVRASGTLLKRARGEEDVIDIGRGTKPGLSRGGVYGLAWGIGIVLFIIVAVINSYTQIDAGTVGVVKRLGQVQQTTFGPGFHFRLPFIDEVVVYSTKVTSYEASEEPSVSQANYTDVVVDSTTSDGQTVQVTFTVLFRIPAEQAPQIAQEVGDMNAVVENVVKAYSRSVSREVPKGLSAEELYTQKGQQQAQALIEQKLAEDFGEYGVAIDQYLIRRVTFAEEYVKAVEAKQIAKQEALTEQNLIARQEAIKQQTIINAEGEAEKKKIEAGGEAEAIRLKQEALAQNPLVIQYEFVQKLSPNVNWGVLPDGVLPLIDMEGLMGGSSTGGTTTTTEP